MDGKLTSIKQMAPNVTYRRWQTKQYVPMIYKMMNDLIS